MKIEIKNLNFGYEQEKNIINNLNLILHNVNITAILGVSGSGKSTLLRLLSGLLLNKNDSQSLVTINGLCPKEFRKTGKLSFMFQEPTLFPNLSVYENITFPIKIRKLVQNEKNIEDIISSVGLSQYKNYLPRSLSGGMKTRVALARSFITYPSLLLLDEPFSSLDIAWRTELYNELKMFQQKFNTTVLFVTHDIDEALLLADKILIMGIEGEIIKEYELHKNRLELFQEVYNSIINNYSNKYKK